MNQKKIIARVIDITFGALLGCCLFASLPVLAVEKSFYDYNVTSIDGKPESFRKYAGKVVLVVNTASQCGYTPQYEGLEKLYEKYQSQGLVILGFPSNDFGKQEPGSDPEIASFAHSKFGIEFPLFSKADVVGPGIQPVYQWLVQQDPLHDPVGWNFEKFLISRKGAFISRYKSAVTPQAVELNTAIEAALKLPHQPVQN